MNKKKTYYSFLSLLSILLPVITVNGQQLKLGNHPSSINKAALLELESHNQGLRLPRADTATVNIVIHSLSSQALRDSTNGMLIYQPSDSSIYYRSGGYWAKILKPKKSILSLNGSSSLHQSFGLKMGSQPVDDYPHSGFYTDVLTGKHTLVLLQASGGRVGVVNGGKQTWYGRKQFRDSVGIESLTPGSIPFMGKAPYNYLSEDTLHLFWDKVHHRLGIGTNSPSNTVEIDSKASHSSGLTFTHLTSSSPVSNNGKAIGVDASGKVVRTVPNPVYYDQNGSIKITKVWLGKVTAQSGNSYTDNLTQIDISSAGFTHIYAIQATAMNHTTDQENHILVSIISYTNTTVNFITLKTQLQLGTTSALPYNDQEHTKVFLRVEGN